MTSQNDSDTSKIEPHGQSASVKPGTPRYAWVILATGFLSIVICWGVWRSFGVFLKPILEEFGWTRAETTGPTIIFFLMNAIMGVFIGKLVDKYGPRLAIPVFGAIMGIGYILTSQITSLWQFYLSYGLIVGTGSVVSYIPFVTVVSRWFQERRGAFLGILVSGIGVGMMVGPPVIQFLIQNLGWRTSFILLGALIFVAMITSGRLLRFPSEKVTLETSLKIDPGNLVSGQDLRSVPLPLGTLLKTRALWLLFFTHFALSFCIEMATVHIVAYATDLAIAAVVAATLVTVIGVTSTIGKLSIGALSDKIGRKISMAGSLTLLGLSLACLPFARDLPSLYVFAAVFGLAYGGYGPVLPAIIGDIYGVKSMGMLMGFITIGAGMGAAIGPVLAGYIFDVQGSYSLAFWLGAGIAIVAALAAANLRPIQKI